VATALVQQLDRAEPLVVNAQGRTQDRPRPEARAGVHEAGEARIRVHVAHELDLPRPHGAADGALVARQPDAGDARRAAARMARELAPGLVEEEERSGLGPDV